MLADWPGHRPGAPELAAILVEAGADVNAPFVGEHQETALHWAASADDVALLDALLDLGADLEARGGTIAGGTALDDACGYEQWGAAARLLVAWGGALARGSRHGPTGFSFRPGLGAARFQLAQRRGRRVKKSALRSGFLDRRGRRAVCKWVRVPGLCERSRVHLDSITRDHDRWERGCRRKAVSGEARGPPRTVIVSGGAVANCLTGKFPTSPPLRRLAIRTGNAAVLPQSGTPFTTLVPLVKDALPSPTRGRSRT